MATLLDDDDNSWVADLENALLEECSATDIYCICKGKPLPESLRPEVWQICLDVRDKGNQLEHFNEIFDLPNQTILREDCKEFITKKLDNDDLDKLSIISDLESIITYYCKSHNVKYYSNNGWLDILLPLLTLKITKSVIYNIFEAIIDIYIPQNLQQYNNNDNDDDNIGINNGNNAFNILRLLLLYHDPELCSFLDTKRIQPEKYCLKWFQTLFAATNNNLQVIINMWDYYFQQSDPYFIFFLSLIIIINARDQILSMKINDNTSNNDDDDVDNRKNDNEKIINFLQQMPNSLEIDDVQDFCSLAQYYSNKTPTSFRSDLLQQPQQQINQQLCLPVNVNELLENSIGGNNGNSSGGGNSGNNVRFFLIDCRPIEQYNSGHLSIAYHLDCNLMLQEPQSYHTVIQGLLSAQKQSILYNSLAGGEHLCFLGSGRNDEDQYLYMIIASFLQKHTQYVSILNGGYISLHNYLINNNLSVDEFLIDHNPKLCIVCAPYYQQNVYNPTTTTIKNKNTPASTTSSTTTPSTSNDLFGKISAVMKTKSADIKGKLMDYIVNPNNNSSSNSNNNNNGNTNNNSSVTNEDRHVSTTINGKRYRNVAPVFSIDDEHGNVTSRIDDDYIDNNDSINDDNNREIIDISTILKMPDIIANFHCQEVKMNGFMFKSLLIITQNELIVIRESVNDRNKGEIIVKRPLSAIVKITARKRHPDLITFKYGMPDGENLIITDMDRFLIPHAEKATKIVSEQILKQLKLKE